ncbi:MAG: hypothetical protein ABI783_01610 [Actinomycetota bacterium]
MNTTLEPSGDHELAPSSSGDDVRRVSVRSASRIVQMSVFLCRYRVNATVWPSGEHEGAKSKT